MMDTATLKGIIPPMVTPLNAEGKIDLESTKKLVEHLIAGKVKGIFILGTTGESASLSLRARLYFIEEVLKMTDGRISVLVGITDSSMEASILLAEHAKKHGAIAVVSAPPFYYTLGQAELTNYYTTLADRSPLPVFLYNMPSNTKIHFEQATVVSLSKHPNIIGLKDSSGNTKYFQKLLFEFRDQPEFLLFVGPEELLAETVMMGGAGGVCGGANLFPELYCNLYAAAEKNDRDRILELQTIVMEISNNIYTVGKYESSYLKGLKASLEILGLCRNRMAFPLQSFEEREFTIVQERLERIKTMVDRTLSLKN
ncbi:dihydrodipicolinate synthase family protein [Flagellimonas aurea]|uniref:dihydrodipicolinate synthase family protein n=1 Tax=Flagellimonas aurea TaxID=2915619 RepID=UPI0035D08FF4